MGYLGAFCFGKERLPGFVGFVSNLCKSQQGKAGQKHLITHRHHSRQNEDPNVCLLIYLLPIKGWLIPKQHCQLQYAHTHKYCSLSLSLPFIYSPDAHKTHVHVHSHLFRKARSHGFFIEAKLVGWFPVA